MLIFLPVNTANFLMLHIIDGFTNASFPAIFLIAKNY